MLAKTLTCVSILLAVMASMPSAYGQRAGYQTAIAPPVIVQPGFSNGVTPFIAPPIVTTSYSQIYSGFPADHQPRAVAVPSVPQFRSDPPYGHVISGYGGTVVIPNTIITNNTFIVQQPVVPAVAVAVVPNVIPARTFVPAAPVVLTAPAHGDRPGPPIGTPRQEVIQQYGNPVTTMYSYSGETLYFSGGASVFLQNGKVATPQRPN